MCNTPLMASYNLDFGRPFYCQASCIVLSTGRKTSVRETQVWVTEGALTARIGAYRMDLVPARPNVFGGRHTPFTAAEAVAFTADSGGISTSVAWNGASFTVVR